jgi:ATP-binding cassette, subfamily C, bacterial LapB
MTDSKKQLAWALKRLAQSQHSKLDGLRLSASLQAIDTGQAAQQQLAVLVSRMGFDRPQSLKTPDPAYLPLLAFTDAHGWLVVLERTAQGPWRCVGEGGKYLLDDGSLQDRCMVLSTRTANVAFGWGALAGRGPEEANFIGHVYATLRLYRGSLVEAMLASAFIGFLALATSLFSMQVYDRVIPTRSEYTLIILASGVLLTILIELSMKFARAKVMDHVIVGLDNRLSREIFARLLNLRVDQVPASVGSLAGQVRGYEQVRGFYTASTLFTLIDLPMALIFILLIMLIGHPLVAAVPLVFGLIALWIGLSIRTKITQQAVDGAQYSNLKTGLLVEAVEGIETIKSGSGAWKFLSRWIGVNQQTIRNDLKTRHLTESVSYLAATIQQISYAGLVVAGAWVVMQGHMTMGALIACSILSGRILAPVMAIPGLLVQHAHAKAALEGLEKLYQLKVDHHDIDNPLTPDVLRGHYQMHETKFAYGDNPPSLVLTKPFEIKPGERIAVLGPIGAGKSTLLRLLSGMYQPLSGRVLIDGLDLSHVHRQVISDHIGYLQQDHRLFQGTLRENLLIGLPDPGDESIKQAMQRTGLDKVVAAHPKGLDRAINEGGKGLSGGQKQLLAFTRLVLTDAKILLLDEPTATMDDEQERRCLQVLAEEANKGKTMVIVTHKPTVLPIVTRIVVVAGSSIVVDGPRDAVLAQLQQRQQQAQQAAQGVPATPSSDTGAASKP